MKLFSKKTFPRGVHPKDGKALSAGCAVEVLPLPEDVFISLAQNAGAPATAVVAAGDKVKRGQLIAKAGGYVSADVHASVSGEVAGIVNLPVPSGGSAQHIHIKRAGDESVTLPPMADKTAESIRSRVAEAGIIGMGGAGFPTAVKLKPSNPVDTIIINGAECEPYLTCDDRLMRQYAKEIFEGAKLIAQACGASSVIFGVESNKPESIAALCGCGAEVAVLKKKYPQGAEKQLIYAILKRVVPAGKLPAEVGASVQNVATAYAVYQAVEKNIPLTERIMTVSGGGINSPKNLLVPVGTSLKYIADFCGGVTEDTVKLVSGGPMMGNTLLNLDFYTGKGSNGLLAFTEKEAAAQNPTPCIHCGRCARACPMLLMPMYIDAYALVNEWDLAVKYGALNCFECGCCAYVCPAKRMIVQSARLTKAKLRERK